MNNKSIFIMEHEDKELDDIWLKKFEELDKDYSDLYDDDNFYINIHFIYVNQFNNIEKMKYEQFFMSKPNYIERDEIIGLIQRNYVINNVKYILLSILKYNINLYPENIKNFLQSQDISSYSETFFTPIKNIDTIKLDKTINMFQDLNNIFFIFYEKDNENNKSKGLLYNNKNNSNNNSNKNINNNSNYTNNVTKRVVIKTNKKHTRKI